MSRYGKGFCKGVNVPDAFFKEQEISGDVYLYEKSREKGIREYAFYSESYWKRINKVKEPGKDSIPELDKTNYPYMDKVFCADCGSRLVRYIQTKNRKVFWICNGYKRKGSSFCKGVRVPDDELKDIRKITYISERRKPDGKKYYSYFGQKAGKEAEGQNKTEDGSILQGIN